MKINRIYIKVFLSFLVLLLIVEALIFGLFKHLTLAPGAHSRYGQMFEAVASVSRRYVSEQLTGPGRTDFLSYLTELSANTGVVIWLQKDESVTFKTFNDQKPFLERPAHTWKKPSYTFKRQNHGMAMQVEIPLTNMNDESLFLFYDARGMYPNEGRFLQGLLLLTLILGLLLFPFSRYISKPLQMMRDSARRISRGHLDERVKVSGGDEIGQLGEAFNDMAGNLEKMVNGTREMTAHVSHELRSPLARLRVAIELLEEKVKVGEGEAAERLFGTMNNEIEEMDYLIGRILLLSKIEQRDASVEKKPYDLRDLVNDTIERYGNLFKKKSLSLQMHVTSVPAIVKMVKEDISMALSTLMENTARYATEHTTVDITVNLQGGIVLFSIKNRDCDFTEEELGQIFEPFTPLKGSTGAGLGLALVKKVVENHNGSVEATCEEGLFSIVVKLASSGE